MVPNFMLWTLDKFLERNGLEFLLSLLTPSMIYFNLFKKIMNFLNSLPYTKQMKQLIKIVENFFPNGKTGNLIKYSMTT